jgi:very-short-patch-repair endonuclease
VLISGEDVPVDLLRDHGTLSQSLAAACEARQKAAAQLGDLGIEIDADEALHEWDAANWLLDALDEHGEELPAALVLAATSDAVKEQIEASRSRVKKVKKATGDSIRESWSYLRKVFDVKSPVSIGLTIAEESFSSLANWLEERSADLEGLRLWMRFRQIQSDLEEQGVPGIVEELLKGEFHPDEARSAFDACFYRKWLDMVYQSDDHLREFEAHDHERLIQKFRDLDRQIIRNGYCRVRSRLLNDPNRPHAELGGAPNSSELGTLQRECNKKSRHLPLRSLFRKIPDMMIRLKPCVMMSPLAVSTYLDTDQIQFDLVIFDEASQVRPFDAIGAIYRGKQLVVAGDQKQMPPTTFFDRMGTEDDLDEDEDESGLDNLRDYESILDDCLSIGLPRKRLRWHYRSKREQLIAFSNHHFYDNDLVTFPSVQDGDGARAVEHVFVEDGRWKSGAGGGFNDIEARRTVELIFEHFENHPNSSLGVVTFNQRQQVAVLDYLYEVLKVRPEMEEFCSESVEEALFVKNLENVQGDERDVILLSMAYGFDQNGKFHKRFGPLNRQGGERRLNVAITRARERIIFVSSVRSRDLDLSSTVKVGPRLLKSYIEYAERGITALGAERVEDSGADFDSPFEAEVFSELERHGFDVRKQIGCGGYRIDLAIVHPDYPGQFVLGIECDGATYNSSKTARDRDRLRQSVLEDNLGWTIFRIWSTDWIRDRKRQLRRVIDAYEQAMLADSTDNVPAEEALPEHPEGMQPKIIERKVHSENNNVRNFDNIDAVPNEAIVRILLVELKKYGATERDDLIRQVARELGFLRTAHRIRARVGDFIDQCVAQGRLKTQEDGRLVLTR